MLPLYQLLYAQTLPLICSQNIASFTCCTSGRVTRCSPHRPSISGVSRTGSQITDRSMTHLLRQIICMHLERHRPSKNFWGQLAVEWQPWQTLPSGRMCTTALQLPAGISWSREAAMHIYMRRLLVYFYTKKGKGEISTRYLGWCGLRSHALFCTSRSSSDLT